VWPDLSTEYQPGSTFAAELKDRVETWNDLLRKKVADLAPVGTQAPRSVFMFSSNAVLTDVLNDPVKYGFAEKDITQEGGRIWEDALHVTSDVQKVIAEQFVNVMLS
jgi:phospholipase/lecithinase/hemolysin